MESSQVQQKTRHSPVSPLALAPSTLFLAAVVIGATSPTPAGLLGAALVAAVGIACAVFLLSPPRRRRRSERARAPRPMKRKTSLRPGDYVAVEGSLYRVEHVLGDRVLIEDCRNGELFDAAAADVEKARKVKRSVQQVNASGGD